MKSRCLAVGGGVDSWAVAIAMKEMGIDYDLFFLDYGQACAEQEVYSCLKLAENLDLNLITYNDHRIKAVNQDGLLFGLGDNPIVNLRNLEIIQACAASGYTEINLALLNERGIMFPDANKNFIHQVGSLYQDAYNITVDAPFILADKWDFVVSVHHRHQFLDNAFTCWTPVGNDQCGVCAHCVKLKNIKQYYEEKYGSN